MRSIDKSNPLKSFDEYVEKSSPTSWDKSSSGKRKKLAQYIHEKQQGGLCAYCEDDLPKPAGSNKNEIDISHIDHIRQKGNPKFKHLEFEQRNLVLSCKGYPYKTTPPLVELTKNGRIRRNKEEGLKREFCGFYKDAHPTMIFDETLFLFPTELEDIETYFYYEVNGKITPNPIKPNTAQIQYTIDLLNLNHDYLVEQRSKEYELFLEKEALEIRELLTEDFPLNRFHSMLIFLFL
jgi:uncharacterized protein (TIGR02646 family)